MEKALDDMRETERYILMIMRHFEIPHGTLLTGQIPGQLEYEVWANDNDTIYINKIKNLQPEADIPNIIVIKLWSEDDGKEED